MNERTFNYQLSAASGSNQQEFEENPLFRDHWAEQQASKTPNNGKINNAARANESWKNVNANTSTTSFVYKLKKETP